MILANICRCTASCTAGPADVLLAQRAGGECVDPHYFGVADRLRRDRVNAYLAEDSPLGGSHRFVVCWT